MNNTKKILIFRLLTIISVMLLSSLFNLSRAESPVIESYDKVATSIFWNELYSNGGWSLYCGFRFDRDESLTDGRLFVIEQIYPVSWMLKTLSCHSRQQCREESNPLYTRMEADMHNLYPVWQEINTLRRDTLFGEIEGEDWRYPDCDFEKQNEISEPRPIARGNIARSIFYMHAKYGLPVDAKMLELMKKWNREDPPSNQETQRNELIEKLQGTRNAYIDNPSLAEQL